MPSSSLDIPTQPLAPFGPEWLVNQFTNLSKLITDTNTETRAYMEEKFKGFDDRLRKIENGEIGYRADLQGQITAIDGRLKVMENQNLDGRLGKVEPVSQFSKWMGAVLGGLTLVLIWGILTHTVIISYLAGGAHP